MSLRKGARHPGRGGPRRAVRGKNFGQPVKFRGIRGGGSRGKRRSITLKGRIPEKRRQESAAESGGPRGKKRKASAKGGRSGATSTREEKRRTIRSIADVARPGQTQKRSSREKKDTNTPETSAVEPQCGRTKRSSRYPWVHLSRGVSTQAAGVRDRRPQKKARAAARSPKRRLKPGKILLGRGEGGKNEETRLSVPAGRRRSP